MSLAKRRNRPEATNKLYQSHRWKRQSLLFKRIHKWCAMCAEHGVMVVGEVTDHKVAHRGNEALFWDQNNWQVLCKPCHDGIKQMLEKSGYDRTIGVDGYPCSDSHPFSIASRKQEERERKNNNEGGQ
jgi:5-methylcytosine-specific restriction enzyme A